MKIQMIIIKVQQILMKFTRIPSKVKDLTYQKIIIQITIMLGERLISTLIPAAKLFGMPIRRIGETNDKTQRVFLNLY